MCLRVWRSHFFSRSSRASAGLIFVRRSVLAKNRDSRAVSLRNIRSAALSLPPSCPRTPPDHRGQPRFAPGEVAEWLNAPHSKCGIGASLSGVRIPPSPPYAHKASRRAPAPRPWLSRSPRRAPLRCLRSRCAHSWSRGSVRRASAAAPACRGSGSPGSGTPSGR